MLDEPTNHLDITSREILTDVLDRFRGTILFVSHDRSLVDALATQVWAIEEEKLIVHRGNYSDYQVKRRVQQEAEQPTPAPSAAPRQRKPADGDKEARERVQRAVALEQEIGELEAELRELEQELNLASRNRQVEELHRRGREYEAVQGRLQELMEEWAQVEMG
ncbi:MAG: hypothetical protein U9Q78_03260 [Chloroflexota bacterium]|nr:hypothetical protein [Chloroflexota bacterium]